MTVINLGPNNDTATDLRLTIEVGNWCTEQGLAFYYDYDWTYIDGSFCVVFNEHCEDVATLFALRWVK